MLYIGKGSGARRLSSKSFLAKKIKVSVKTLKSEILFDGLSNEQAISLEKETIDSFLKDGVNLYNVAEPSKVKEITYNDVSKMFYLSEESPSFLKRKSDNKIAGGITGKGKQYYKVGIKKSYFQVHRIVWSLFNHCDVPPDLVVDHIDGNSLNNHPLNLRLTNHLGNAINSNLSKRNKGVQWVNGRVNSGGAWKATWYENHKQFSKRFSPTVLYPDMPLQEATSRAYEDAVSFRKEKEEKLDLTAIQSLFPASRGVHQEMFEDFVKKTYQFNILSGQANKASLNDIENQLKLIQEEVDETKEALSNGDIVGVLDGLVDTLVVTLGLIQKLENIGVDVNRAMHLVADNNLSKHVDDEEIAKQTLKHYATQGIKVSYRYNALYKKFTILDENNKVRKPIGYLPVDLKDYVPEGLEFK